MAQQTTFACDCGCGSAAVTDTENDQQGWLKLSQFEFDNRNDEPKLSRKLHFKSIYCLNKWVRMARGVLPGMLHEARTFDRRGTIHSSKVSGLIV